MSEQERKALSQEELERQRGEPLPDREAMSVLPVGDTMPLPEPYPPAAGDKEVTLPYERE